jgi:hypothetical protein
VGKCVDSTLNVDTATAAVVDVKVDETNEPTDLSAAI